MLRHADPVDYELMEKGCRARKPKPRTYRRRRPWAFLPFFLLSPYGPVKGTARMRSTESLLSLNPYVL